MHNRSQKIANLILPFRNTVYRQRSILLVLFLNALVNINSPVTIILDLWLWKLWDIMLKTAQWEILCDQ